jgi:formylglycine-generating enzyme required for sulfatase activity
MLNESFEIALSDSTILKMIWCPPGGFMFGSRDEDITVPKGTHYRASIELIETPQIFVEFKHGFWIAEHPLTIRQVNTFESISPVINEKWDSPINGLTWDNAKGICYLLDQHIKLLYPELTIGYMDLPTEAQWEYACRSGQSTTWFFGNDVSLYDQYGYRLGMTFPIPIVKQKKPNLWQIYDLYGPVPEWCLGEGLQKLSDTLKTPTYTEAEALSAFGKNPNDDKRISRPMRGSASPDHTTYWSSYRSIVWGNNDFDEYVGLRPVFNLLPNK